MCWCGGDRGGGGATRGTTALVIDAKDWQLQEQGGAFYPLVVLVHPGERFTGDEDIPVEKWDAFSPFTLGKGEERRVAIRYAFGECTLGRGGTLSVSSIAARFSVFGFDRRTEYPLPYVLALRSMPRGGCP
jgi:hypothetical protein